PKSALYADFGDFSFWRMSAVSTHLNGGFARAADLEARAVLTDLTGAEDLIAAEEGAVEHMNSDHAEAVGRYAVQLLGARDGKWQVTGLDPDGLDLALGDATLRLAFGERITSPDQLRKTLVVLAGEVGAKG